ncbi:hypothetical protein C2G38_2241696 [Gigaspora rosea]|uniref:Uncharacterized protein n=1 Tax=Gigaspora rosea TaxID=44941 RepID=A0A397W0Y5_9GLOM|nr:hypothetical protein C2G38_2241696 [Gigaspora rosea]
MKSSIFGIILTLLIAFAFVIDASEVEKKSTEAERCVIKILTPDYGTVLHHGYTHRAIWKPYYCKGLSDSVGTFGESGVFVIDDKCHTLLNYGITTSTDGLYCTSENEYQINLSKTALKEDIESIRKGELG